jgi:catechol 2,3-dioxygenase-like lactoylglutathione lyase family enzyme
MNQVGKKNLAVLSSLFFFCCLFAAPFEARAQEPPIAGVYEICIGLSQDQYTGDSSELEYWKLFGYTEGATGELSASEAEALYGVESALTAIRLNHQDADHGLIRLMIWDEPLNEGLEQVKMLVPGSRWASMLTQDVYRIYNHAQYAQEEGYDIHLVKPQWGVIYKIGEGEPFFGDMAGVREMILMRPLSRQMFFQRFGYTIPDYGTVNPDCRFKSSQVTHVGLVYESDDGQTADFYGDVLGLLQTKEEYRSDYADLSEATRLIYGMEPGDYYYGYQFDDPRSSTNFQEARSGRLLLRRLPSELEEKDYLEYSRPGSLGISNYTYRVQDINEYHTKIINSDATGVTAIQENEFGEQSFSFYAPDGNFWTLVEEAM